MAKDEGRAVSDLVERLAGWVEQQPEYPLLFLADRPRRRRAARIIAYRLMVLPSVPSTSPGRANIRVGRKRISRKMGEFTGKLNAKANRDRAKAIRDRNRSRRRSIKRAFDLAWAENDARDSQETP